MTTEITDVLIPEAIKKLKVGQVLMFQKDNQRTDLKITKKAQGRVWAKEITTYAGDEVAIVSRENDGN